MLNPGFYLMFIILGLLLVIYLRILCGCKQVKEHELLFVGGGGGGGLKAYLASDNKHYFRMGKYAYIDYNRLVNELFEIHVFTKYTKHLGNSP